MNEQTTPLDANRKPVRIGDVVRRTMIVDHVGHLYTISMRGLVVDMSTRSIMVTMTTPHRWSCDVWDAIDWTVTGHEGLS